MSKTTSKKIDVHRQLNIPQSTVSDYFSGKTLPSEENIVKLARFFNVNPYDIDPRMVKGNVKNDKLRVKLLTTFDDLNDKNKRKVVDYADTQLKDQWREENIHSINELQRTYTVDVLGAVSAGTGEWLDEEQHNHVAVSEQPLSMISLSRSMAIPWSQCLPMSRLSMLNGLRVLKKYGTIKL